MTQLVHAGSIVRYNQEEIDVWIRPHPESALGYDEVSIHLGGFVLDFFPFMKPNEDEPLHIYAHQIAVTWVKTKKKQKIFVSNVLVDDEVIEKDVEETTSSLWQWSKTQRMQ